MTRPKVRSRRAEMLKDHRWWCPVGCNEINNTRVNGRTSTFSVKRLITTIKIQCSNWAAARRIRHFFQNIFAYPFEFACVGGQHKIARDRSTQRSICPMIKRRRYDCFIKDNNRLYKMWSLIGWTIIIHVCMCICAQVTKKYDFAISVLHFRVRLILVEKTTMTVSWKIRIFRARLRFLDLSSQINIITFSIMVLMYFWVDSSFLKMSSNYSCKQTFIRRSLAVVIRVRTILYFPANWWATLSNSEGGVIIIIIQLLYS